MTVEADTEVYKGYTIEVAIDGPSLNTWKCRITDSRGLLAECPRCNSYVAALTVAHEIIDAEELMPGDIEYQDPREYPDFTG